MHAKLPAQGNPFAESAAVTQAAALRVNEADALGAGGALQQPYAAPAGLADAAGPANAGARTAAPVGVYRDGELVVLHQAAPWPPLCVGCGRVTRERFALPVDWSPLAGEWRVSRTLAAHLCPACGRRRRQGELRLATALVVILGVVLALASGREQLAGSQLVRGLAGACGAGAIALALFLAQSSTPLRWRYAHGREPYFWLAGAPAALLALLPDFSSAVGPNRPS